MLYFVSFFCLIYSFVWCRHWVLLLCIGQPFCLAIVLAFKKEKKGTHVLKLTLTDITQSVKQRKPFPQQRELIWIGKNLWKQRKVKIIRIFDRQLNTLLWSLATAVYIMLTVIVLKRLYFENPQREFTYNYGNTNLQRKCHSADSEFVTCFKECKKIYHHTTLITINYWHVFLINSLLETTNMPSP